MQAFINITLIAIVAFTFSSCTKPELPKEAEVTFTIDHAVDEKNLEVNSPFDYTNKAGNRYNVSELSYTISNMVLIDEGDNEVTLGNSNDVNAFGGGQLGAVSLPNGTYKTMRFTVNKFRHLGKFLDGSNAEQNITIDYSGTPETQENVEIPVGGLTVNGAAKTAYVTFNLNGVYSDATDFNSGATQAEVSPSFSGAFTFSGSYENR